MSIFVSRQDLEFKARIIAWLKDSKCHYRAPLTSLSIFSFQVNSDFERGNTAGAQYNSNQAWKWGMASISIGCLTILVVMVYYLIEVALHATL